MAEVLIIGGVAVALVVFNEWRYGQFVREQRATLAAIRQCVDLVRVATQISTPPERRNDASRAPSVADTESPYAEAERQAERRFP